MGYWRLHQNRAFALRGSILDMWVMVAAGVIGFVTRMDSYPLAPMVLGLILGPIAEENLRRSLELSDGSWDIIYTSPITMGILLLAVISLFTPIILQRRGSTHPS